MLKKIAFSAVFLLLFTGVFGAGMAAAAEGNVSDKVKGAIEDSLSQKHYDYKKGSLELHHVKTIELSEPIEENVSTIKLAVAEYNTVRDNIFYFTNKEIVYFTPEGKVLSLSAVSGIEAVSQYQKLYDDVEGTHMHIGVILALCSLIMLVPGFFAYVWAKQQHSVLTYKLQNNLFDNVGPHTYS